MRKRLNLKFIALLLVATAVFVGVVHVVHGFQVNRRADIFLVQAEKAREEDQLSDEVDYLERYLVLRPDDLNALDKYGRALAELSADLDASAISLKALSVLKRVVARDPSRRETLQKLAELSVATAERMSREDRQKLLNDAEKYIETLLANDESGKPPAENQLGQIELLKGRCLENLAGLILTSTTKSENEKGVAAAYERAAQAYERAAKHTPESIEATERLVAMLHGRVLNNPKRAKEAIAAMVERAEKSRDQTQLGKALLARSGYQQFLGLDEDAAADLAQAKKLIPDDAKLLLVSAAAGAGADEAAARTYLERGISLYPKDRMMYLALARLEANSGHLDKALATLRDGAKHMTSRTGRVSLIWEDAETQLDAGAREEPREAIERLTQDAVPPAALDYLRARTLINQNNNKGWSEAASTLERIRGTYSTGDLGQKINTLLALCYERLKQPNDQLMAIQRAADLDPDSVSTRTKLAATLASRGQIGLAIQQYEQAIGALGNPTTPAIRSEIARIKTEQARLRLVRSLQLPEAQREWTKIDELLDEAIKQDPKQVQATVVKSLALSFRNKPEFTQQARELLTKARDAQPDRVELWTTLAGLALNEARAAAPSRGKDQSAESKEQSDRKFQEAAALLDQAQSRFGDLASLRLARIQYWDADWLVRHNPKARDEMTRQVRDIAKFSKEDQAKLLRETADRLLRTDASDEAVSLLKQLAKLQPDDLETRMRLFDTALRAKDVANAEAVAAEIKRIEGQEGAFGPYCEAALLVLQAGKQTDQERRDTLKKASDRLAEAAKHRDDWGRIPLLRAAIDELEGHNDQVIADLLQAVKLGERQPVIYRHLIALLYRAQRYAEADQILRELDQVMPLPSDLKRIDSQIAFQLPGESERARALELARHAAAAENATYADHVWLGQVLSATGKFDEAEAELKKAVDMEKAAPDAWLALVLHYARTRQIEKATEAIEQARQKLPAAQAPKILAACYLAIGKRAQAEEQYKTALEATPNDPTTLRNLATLYIAGNQPTQAESVLRAMIDVEKSKATAADLAWARRTLASVLVATGSNQLVVHQRRFAEAVQLIDQNLKNGQNTEDLFAKASVLSRRFSNQQEAIQILEGLVAGKKPPAEAHLLLARLYLSERIWDKAQEQMLAFVSLQPRNPDRLYDYVRSLLTRNQHDPTFGPSEARRWLERLKTIEPNSFRTVALEAFTLKAEGKMPEGVALLRQAIKVHSKDTPLQQMAGVFEELEQFREAEDLYRKLITEQSGGPRYTLDVIRCLARRNLPDEALDLALDEKTLKALPFGDIAETCILVLTKSKVDGRHYERVAKWLEDFGRKKEITEQQSALSAFYLANVRSFQERFKEAEELYRQVLTREPNNAVALNNLAWLLAVSGGDARHALDLINRSLGAAGQVSELLDTRGVVYLAQGRGDLAAADLEKVAVANPSGTSYFHLAQAYLQDKRPEAARRALVRAEERGLKPNDLHPLERKNYQRLTDELRSAPK